MVGVPCLRTRCEAGPSARIGWPWPWRTRSQRISAGPDHEADHERGQHRAAGAEGQVAEQVEQAELVGEREEQVEQHVAALRPADRRGLGEQRASTSRPMPMPSEPLTSSVSPGLQLGLEHRQQLLPRCRHAAPRRAAGSASCRWRIAAPTVNTRSAPRGRDRLGQRRMQGRRLRRRARACRRAPRACGRARSRAARAPRASRPGWRCSSRRSA